MLNKTQAIQLLFKLNLVRSKGTNASKATGQSSTKERARPVFMNTTARTPTQELELTDLRQVS